MLKAEANGTWIDGMISLGIGIVVSLPRFFFTLRRKGSTT